MKKFILLFALVCAAVSFSSAANAYGCSAWIVGAGAGVNAAHWNFSSNAPNVPISHVKWACQHNLKPGQRCMCQCNDEKASYCDDYNPE